MNYKLIAVFNENAVAAVLASAHYKIGENSFFPVGTFADNNSSAGIIVFAKYSAYIICASNHICCPLSESFSRQALLPGGG